MKGFRFSPVYLEKIAYRHVWIAGLYKKAINHSLDESVMLTEFASPAFIFP